MLKRQISRKTNGIIFSYETSKKERKMNDYEFLLNTALDLLGQVRFYPKSNLTWSTTRCVDVPTHNRVNMPAVKSVIFNKEATIVYFADGTKCIVRKSAMDEYNREHAVVYAIVKRAYGTVNADGTVDGNGMGNMLAKVVANGYDQEAHNKAEEEKKAAKQKPKFVGDDDHEKYAWGYQPAHNWTDVTPPQRDKYGRFVKKSNRK